MTLLAAFVSHEWLTQSRAVRFRVAAMAYVTLSAAPAVAVSVVAAGADYVIGPASHAAALLLFQPMLTTLFAGALSIDAITRERDESAFAVLSLAPISAAGYVLRRWIAIVVIAAPVTMLPQIAGAALAAHAQGSVHGLMPFVWTWLLQVLPVLLVMSAAMLACGTITGRPILAILGLAAMLPLALGALQAVLALAHRKLDGPGRFLLFDERAVQELVWTVRGFWALPVASESGWPIEAASDAMVPGALTAASASLLLIGIAPAFLRRTKRDLRPWRIRQNHPLRTFLRTLNRVREEYALDAGPQRADILLFVATLVLAGFALATLLAREAHFAGLAARRYAAEIESNGHPMSEHLVVVAARIEGDLGRELRTRSTLEIENRGTRAESHLAFTLHPGLALECDGRRRRFRITRTWDRVAVDLEQPIPPGALLTLTCTARGIPDEIDFALIGGGSFQDRYGRYRRATTAVELSDLSRSRILPAASRDRMLLAASDFTLVPRYERPNAPPARLETNLRTPLLAADSCGGIGRELRSRCSIALSSFTVTAARMRAMPLTPTTTLLHLDRHESLARTHAPALAEALAIAERTWPGVLASRGVFAERPTKPGERVPWRDDEMEIRSSGVLHLVPETMFIRREPMPPGVIAAAMVSSALLSRRALAPDERWFFTRFYEEAARARLGGQRRSVIVAPNPSTQALLRLGDDSASQVRLRAVLAELEWRAGADRVAEGISDFVAMSGEGNGRQLLDAIAKRAGVDLDRFYRDYLTGDALPQLTFESVTFTRSGEGWDVRGSLRNEGTGEVFCPVVLRTEQGSIRRTIRVDSAQSVEFAIFTVHPPRTLQLDPDRVCYRVARIGLVDSVEYRGVS